MKAGIAILLTVILIAGYGFYFASQNQQNVKELAENARVELPKFDEKGEFRGIPFQLIAVSEVDKKAVLKRNDGELFVVSEGQLTLENKIRVQRVTSSSVVVKSMQTAETSIVHLLNGEKQGLVVSLSSTPPAQQKRVIVSK